MRIDSVRADFEMVLRDVAPDLERIDWVRPPNWQLGHMGVPLFRLAKKRGVSPKELATTLATACNTHKSMPRSIEKASAVGPFLNVFLNWSFIVEQFRQAFEQGRLFEPRAPSNGGGPILVEYSSPNLAKPLGLHHLRSTMIGHVLSNLFEFHGYPVIRYTYPGDMGSSFGKLCVGAEKQFGKGWESRRYTLDELYHAYLTAQDLEQDEVAQKQSAEWTLALERKDRRIIPFHDEVYRVTRTGFEVTYQELGVWFDVWDGEFNYASQTEDLLRFLQSVPGVQVRKSEGAQVLSFDGDVLPSMILVKSDGATVYLARDILSAIHRIKTYKPAVMLYVVGSEQKLHLKQLTHILKQAKLVFSGDETPEIHHVPYGLMAIEGLKMSTRKGTVVLLSDVIVQATQEMKKRMGAKGQIGNLEEKAKQMGIGAIVFGDLFHSISKNVSFSWDDILSVEGDTGPYIFYAYARLSGILRKMELSPDGIETPKAFCFPKSDLSAMHQMLFELMQFDHKVSRAVLERDPSVFARFLLDLAKASNGFYHAYPIKAEVDSNIRSSLVWFVTLIQKALDRGARLLNMGLLEAL